MAGEKEEKKKSGILRRIIKWIGLGLLVLLLIAAIIFQAPWKVITLLVIILAACTILPKQLRKWFWLSVGVVVIALVVWVFLPDETEGWRPYTFDEELAALEANRAILDEENAARIYNHLLDSYDSNSFSHDFLVGEAGRIIRFEAWSGDDYPEVAQWLGSHKRTIARLLEAAQMEKCRFPMAADSVKLNEAMDRLAPMRRWAYLLVYAANNDLGEGRINQGLEKYIAVLQMSRHQYQQALIVDLLVGIALDALGHKQFNRIVMSNDTTEEHLSVTEDTLSKNRFNWSSDFPRILECEKLLAKNMLCRMLYEVNAKGKTRFIRDTRAAIKTQFPEDIPPQPYWRKKLTKAAFILGWFFVPSTPQKAGKIIDASYERLYTMAAPNFDWQKEPGKFSLTSAKFNYRFTTEMLVYILEPAYYRIHDIYLRLMTDKKGSRIIIALRRYKNQNGFWPINLDDVKSMAPPEIFVDSINGGDFVYEITEEDFRLYSKGKNGIDEDGERDDIAGADDWLIWPPRRTGDCEPEEENIDAEQQ